MTKKKKWQTRKGVAEVEDQQSCTMGGIFTLCSGSDLTSHGWTTKRKGHTCTVRLLKKKVKELPCLALVNPETFKIVETDTSDDDDGYGEVLFFFLSMVWWSSKTKNSVC